jgi:hypothetical protein
MTKWHMHLEVPQWDIEQDPNPSWVIGKGWTKPAPIRVKLSLFSRFINACKGIF